ncbi:hypothetical protein KAU51_01490 [Candidatus Parcubacteria bacterium]|nr:hypothetical protein [Candidatus Parcubacteria bacterium]
MIEIIDLEEEKIKRERILAKEKPPYEPEWNEIFTGKSEETLEGNIAILIEMLKQFEKFHNYFSNSSSKRCLFIEESTLNGYKLWLQGIVSFLGITAILARRDKIVYQIVEKRERFCLFLSAVDWSIKAMYPFLRSSQQTEKAIVKYLILLKDIDQFHKSEVEELLSILEKRAKKSK